MLIYLETVIWEGIVNSNRVEYSRYMTIQKKQASRKTKSCTLCDEINTLKDEMSEIKNMLIKVLEK